MKYCRQFMKFCPKELICTSCFDMLVYCNDRKRINDKQKAYNG